VAGKLGHDLGWLSGLTCSRRVEHLHKVRCVHDETLYRKQLGFIRVNINWESNGWPVGAFQAAATEALKEVKYLDIPAGWHIPSRDTNQSMNAVKSTLSYLLIVLDSPELLPALDD
jgi:hypothetical protein